MAIIKTTTSRTSGSNTGVFQVFLANEIAENNPNLTTPFIFDAPKYNLRGATKDFYSQTTDSISTSLNNIKKIFFDFTANTESLSGTTKLLHDIYKIPFSAFAETSEIFTLQSDELGIITGFTATDDFKNSITSAITTIEEYASGITQTAHTLVIPQKVKPIGNFTVDMFEDKAQYFIDTRTSFDRPNGSGGDIKIFSAETGSFEDASATMFTADTQNIIITNPAHTITGGTFGGLDVKGYFFVYMKVPSKPDLNVIDGAPAVSGSLSTISPIFSFNNVADGDYYKLNVVYDTTNENFTGDSVFSFEIPKQEGDAEFIRTFSTMITPDSPFLYRIGNVKELINLFDIKQSITVWSDSVSAETTSEGMFTLSGVSYYHSAVPGNELSGVNVSITLKSTSAQVIELVSDSSGIDDIPEGVPADLDPDVGTIFTAVTASDGTYSFENIQGGVYTVVATHPLYRNKEFDVEIESDTNLNLVFEILWGNTILTFGGVGSLTMS